MYSLDDQYLYVVDVYSLVNIAVAGVVVVVVVVVVDDDDDVKEIDHTYDVFRLEQLLIVEEQESLVQEVDEDFDALLNYILKDIVHQTIEKENKKKLLNYSSNLKK